MKESERGKQVALYMKPDVREEAMKQAKKEGLSFSGYLSKLVLTNKNKVK